MFPCLFFHCSTTINSYAMKFCRVFQEKFAFNNIKNGDLHCTKDVLLYQRLEVVRWFQSKKTKQITNINFNLTNTLQILPFSKPVGIWILKWSLGRKGKPNEMYNIFFWRIAVGVFEFTFLFAFLWPFCTIVQPLLWYVSVKKEVSVSSFIFQQWKKCF